jgi:hypothetical protein
LCSQAQKLAFSDHKAIKEHLREFMQLPKPEQKDILSRLLLNCVVQKLEA